MVTTIKRYLFPALSALFISSAAVAGVMLLVPFFAYSGTLDSPAAPTGTSSAMYTLTDIYNRLDTGTATAKRTGAFTEPSSGPAATWKTLDDVMGLVNSRAHVEKTGQTTLSATGDDGDLEKGVTWPNPRFTDNGNGTVMDNLTGLIWLKNGDAFGTRTWAQALSDANTLASGSAGLTDGSVAGDWRLPNVKELQSLINYGRSSNALPDHPFDPVRSAGYWSSTTYPDDTTNAWDVSMATGIVRYDLKTVTYYVWPVRAGQ